MDLTYPLAPIANFLACALLLLPFLSTSIRFGSRNIPVTMFALWSTAINFIQGVNTLIWFNNVNDSAPIWCDIGECLYFSQLFNDSEEPFL